MERQDVLADRFEGARTRLRAVAYRMLGSPTEADDAVQEAWLRLSRTDPAGIDNLDGWLTAVVARVCLDMLRSRSSRREDPLEPSAGEPVSNAGALVDPEDEAVMADSVGLALLVVLDTLSPAERVAFVLHDLFDLPFDDIAPIVGRTPEAARQLASRARRRVRGTSPEADPARQRRVVNAFLAASRGGDFTALLALLDPEVVLRADAEAVGMGIASGIRGAEAVAEMFSGRARAARPALVGGGPGLAWNQRGETRMAFGFTISNEKITGIELIADPERLRELDVVTLDG